jgi:hypothetical protein
MGLAILSLLGAAADAVAWAAASQAYRTLCQFRNARKTNKPDENSSAEQFTRWMQKMCEFDCSEFEDTLRKGLLEGSAEGKKAHHARDRWLTHGRSVEVA